MTWRLTLLWRWPVLENRDSRFGILFLVLPPAWLREPGREVRGRGRGLTRLATLGLRVVVVVGRGVVSGGRRKLGRRTRGLVVTAVGGLFGLNLDRDRPRVLVDEPVFSGTSGACLLKLLLSLEEEEGLLTELLEKESVSSKK